MRMRPLAVLTPEVARALRGVVFDLDDTVLDHGCLTLEAYAALYRLCDTGLVLVACTGRPAGWGEVIQRQWPVSATVAENGAVRLFGGKRGAPMELDLDGGVAPGEADELASSREKLLAFAARIVATYPEVSLADDVRARMTDVTLDIGERRAVSSLVVAAIERDAALAGLRTTVSSVHLHLTHAASDKASGAMRALARLGEAPSRARASVAFIGDSGNDAAAFAAFETTFGVANVRAHLARMTVPPKYVTRAERGGGFAEFANLVATLRAA